MSDFASHPEKAVDQWLETQHRTLVNDLAAALDLDAGLGEAIAQAEVARSTDSRIALKLSVAALRIHPDGETQSSLIDLLTNNHYSNTLTGHSGPVNSVVFSPNGHILATASSDRTVRIWDVTDLRRPAEVATLTGCSGTVNVVAFSPDGRTLATADAGQTVRLWDLTDPHQPSPADTLSERTGLHRMALPSVETLTVHPGQVYAVAFAKDWRTLATASSDRTVKLWDLSDPHAVRQLGPPLSTGHTYSVVGAAFAPDGRTLATASSDRTVTLWDLSTRTQPRPVRLPLTSQNSVVRSLDFAPNGHILATGSDYGTTILWDLNSINDIRNHAAERACSITEGGLNRDEWARYISGLPYENTCPNM
jgi:WD40 repeat protein